MERSADATEGYEQKPAGGTEAPGRLFNRNFVLLWQGRLVSRIGTELSTIALIFWLKHATGSGSMMGLLAMISGIPSVVLAPIAGTIADWFNRKSIIVLTDLLKGAVTLSIAALFFLAPDQTRFLVGWVMAAAVIESTIGAFFGPAIMAAVPDLVPKQRVPAANSVLQSTGQVCSFVGQASGGVLFRLLGAPLMLLIDGLTFVFSAVSEMFIRLPDNKKERSGSAGELMRHFLGDVGAGFAYAWRDIGLRNTLIVLGIIDFVLSPFIVALPFHVEDHLGAAPDWFGYALAALGLGSLVGLALVGVLNPGRSTRMWLIVAAIGGVGLSILGLGLVPSKYALVAALGLVGLFAAIASVYISSLIQVRTPSEFRGRVTSFVGLMTAGLTPLGMGLTGLILDATGKNTVAIFSVSGALALLVTAAATLDPHFKEFLSSPMEEQETQE